MGKGSNRGAGAGAGAGDAPGAATRPLRILQVYHSWQVAEPGGVISVLQSLLEGLRQRHEPELLIRDWESPRLARQEHEEQSHFRLRMPDPPERIWHLRSLVTSAMRMLRAAWQLRRLCHERRIDVIHLHYLSPYQLVFTLLHRITGTPYILTVHRGDVAGYPESPRLHRWAMDRVLTQAARVVAVSDALGQALVRVSRAPIAPVTVYNGFTLAGQPVASRDTVEALSTPALPETYAVLVANLRRYKAPDVALRAWQHVAQRGWDVPLVIVGGGPDLEATKKLAGDLGLTGDEVRFLGARPRDHVLQIVQGASLLIAPSRDEGQGVVLLEAGALGVPVVCSDIGPFVEVLGSGDAGWITPVEDHEALAEAVQECLARPEEARRRAETFAARVTATFSLDRMMREYEGLYGDAARPAMPSEHHGSPRAG